MYIIIYTHCRDVHGQRELKHAVQAHVIVLYDVLKSNQYTSRQSHENWNMLSRRMSLFCMMYWNQTSTPQDKATRTETCCPGACHCSVWCPEIKPVHVHLKTKPRELKHAVQANVIVLYDVLKSNQYTCTSRQSHENWNMLSRRMPLFCMMSWDQTSTRAPQS